MQYGLAFGYALNRTDGFTNLLLMTVCNFIPVVGPIVLLGYRTEVSLALLRDDELRRHPKFDFNLFDDRDGPGGSTDAAAGRSEDRCLSGWHGGVRRRGAEPDPRDGAIARSTGLQKTR